MTMDNKTYIEIRKLSHLYKYYVYFDKDPYLADHLFIEQKCRVWFDCEYTKSDCSYNIVFCHIRKKDVSKFLSALEKLKQNMMICGHPEYESEVSEFINGLHKLKQSNDKS